ncbi:MULTISPECIES: YhgE/Pip domain-containing protein [Lactobacillaceae]|uniref:YhgE/Pip domain-containing protein n=1 Tax=Lactobacillus sp. HBUAS51381 TaxID=2722743 RepID=UPI001B3B293F|nr:YhgE/Pip domain-containing protein [Lactobacillus sp. HBUAS51381]
MIKGEWNYIRHNRLILISVLAIMFIPFLYSIFFLKSVWDPYGETGELPVAVVNQDKPVTYQGQKLNVGDQTITNLKKNHQLGWKFVSAKTAADGLKHHKYYTVITIPKNFSANAATALNKHPKKMTFTYKTNGSANYIAQVMSEVGSSKLDSQIRAKVTKAYAQATFKQIYAVGQGMDKAAKGSAKLKDGTVTLTDGLNTYTTGVHTLNNGLQQMKTSVKPLATGIQKLSTGSQTLQTGLAKYTSGVGQYASGVNQYTSGVGQLSAKMPTMQAGANKLATGAKTLNTGTYQYVDGVYQLKDGAQQLNSGVGPLKNGVSQLATGSKKLNSGLSTLNSKSGELNTGASNLADGAAQVSAGVQEVQSELGKLTDPDTQKQLASAGTLLTELNALKNDPSLVAMTTALTQPVKDLMAAEVQMNAALSAQSKAAKSLQQDASGSATAGNDSTAVNGAKAATASAQKTAEEIASSEDSAKTKQLATKLQEQLQTAQAEQNKIDTSTGDSNDGTSADASALEAATAAVQNASGELQTALTKVLTVVSSTGLTQEQVASLQTTLSDAQAADLTALQSKLGQLSELASGTDKINKLVQGADELSSGAKTLNSGLSDYTGGVKTAFDGSTTLNNGVASLNAKVPTLTNGVTRILNGSVKLAKKGSALKSGSNQLSTGASQLSSGINQAAVGVNTLNSKTPQLTAAGNKLTSSSGQLMNGAGQLTSGLNTLNSKVPTLTSGVNQLANGSQKLDDNSNQLMQGAKKLSDGNGTLAKSLKSGADQIQAQPLTSKTADMFAAPTKLKHENYSYVPNYGHALAPYVLSVALYVGALVFNFAFPIRKVSREGGTATGWYLSKVSIGAVEGLAMGLIEPALMMLGGLTVDHPGQMILISVFFAEASMFIVMFLSMLLDNPGRFIAMVLLMLQLGGSGGTFPMEVTNHFYNVVHPFLPMTYSILGFRQAITSGMSGMVGQALWVLALFTVLGLALLWPTMWWLQKKHLMGISQLDDNQKLQAVEDPNTNAHS